MNQTNTYRPYGGNLTERALRLFYLTGWDVQDAVADRTMPRNAMRSIARTAARVQKRNQRLQPLTRTAIEAMAHEGVMA